MPYDLFISYSRRDNAQGRNTQLVEPIKADSAPFAKRELVPFFDQQEIHGMQDWRQCIRHGLLESRQLLACLSPAYLKSEYCEWEFVEYLKYEIGHLHGFNGVAPIYFVEVPGWDNKKFEQQCAAWVCEWDESDHRNAQGVVRSLAIQLATRLLDYRMLLLAKFCSSLGIRGWRLSLVDPPSQIRPSYVSGSNRCRTFSCTNPRTDFAQSCPCK
jgi:hypothetical protein